MENGFAPDYLADLIPPLVGDDTPQVFAMLIIINRSMFHLDYTLIHFFYLQLGSVTVFQMI